MQAFRRVGCTVLALEVRGTVIYAKIHMKRGSSPRLLVVVGTVRKSKINGLDVAHGA